MGKRPNTTLDGMMRTGRFQFGEPLQALCWGYEDMS